VDEAHHTRASDEAAERAALEKELRKLRKQLERSEHFRQRTEALKEQNDLLLRNVIGDLQVTQDRLEQAKAELERRVAERTHELVRSNEELARQLLERGRLNDELAAARDAAIAADRAKSAFLATMSHELRTPLNVILGYAELVREDIIDAGVAAIATDVDHIHHAASHLLSIINDILDLAKVEAGHATLVDEIIDLPALLRELAATVDPLVTRGGNRLTLSAAPELGRVHGDRIKLRQTLFNLLGNACKFTSRGEIRLEARLDGAWIEIVVRDSGIGIPEDKLSLLFQPFTQLDNSATRQHSGTGLGLALCRRFVQLMGGHVGVTSQEGVGSAFTVRLPHRPAPAPPRPAPLTG
jgi:signal transduction histidine kinase